MRISSFLEKTRVIVMGLAALFPIIAGFAQPTLALHPATGPTDPAELEAFMDGSIEAQLEAYNTYQRLALNQELRPGGEACLHYTELFQLHNLHNNERAADG